MKVRPVEIVFFVCFLLLVLFQVKTTNVKTAYSFTPYEIDLQIRRMNMYPPVMARLGYIQEFKKEVQWLRKLEGNFFSALDLREYFPSRLPYILSLLVLVGLYFFVKERKRWSRVFLAFLLSLLILIILGPHAKYGPVLLYPFFGFFVVLGVKRMGGAFRR